MDCEQSEANLRQRPGDFILSRLALSCKEQEDRSMKRGARFRGRLSGTARFSGLLLALLWSLEVIIPFHAKADPPSKPEVKARGLIPQPVYPLGSETGLSRLSFQAPDSKEVPSFWAIGSQAWPTGLIPVYQVLDRRSGKYQLVRKPSHGKENVTPPPFLCSPPVLRKRHFIHKWPLGTGSHSSRWSLGCSVHGLGDLPGEALWPHGPGHRLPFCMDERWDIRS